MAKGKKTGGRHAGTPNKLSVAQAFVKRIEDLISKSEGQRSLFALERMACRFITSDDTKVAFGVWSKLVEYKLGKAVQPISGEGGGPLQVQIITNASFPTP